ncbi:MAG: MgtC/SapB family protein [Muribaculaceae bacterium]
MSIFQDIFNLTLHQDVNWANATLRLLLSMVLGAVVGIERMKKGQMAGMRTFSLISTGATLAMLVSIYIPQEFLGLKNGDPGRIAAQVVSGIGFLGAGAIIQMKGSVRGLTTAAGIWITAMIGLAVGAGMYIISIITTLLIIFILAIMNRYEHYANITGESKIIRIKLNKIATDTSAIKQAFAQFEVHISDLFLKYDYENSNTTINVIVRCKSTTDFISLFNNIHADPSVTSITLSNEVNI